MATQSHSVPRLIMSLLDFHSFMCHHGLRRKFFSFASTRYLSAIIISNSAGKQTHRLYACCLQTGAIYLCTTRNRLRKHETGSWNNTTLDWRISLKLTTASVLIKSLLSCDNKHTNSENADPLHEPEVDRDNPVDIVSRY